MSVTSSGLRATTKVSFRRSAVELFSSMRFAISLLVIIAIASIIGTVLKQEDPYPNYVNQFGPFWADIFRSLGLYNMYGSWWFVMIMGFLLVSVSLCVTRNGPKIIVDMRSWKDRVHEASLNSFHHKAEYTFAGPRETAAARIGAFIAAQGYRHVVRDVSGATLIAAKRGAFNKLGYIFAHVAIVVICIGGLLDSGLGIRLQTLLFDKSTIRTTAPIVSIAPSHRLAPWNPAFRGFSWIPEGQHASTAILNQPTGILVQDLPFTIELKKFVVDYYSTGMPKLFASDIVVTDHATGKRTDARVEVNKPFTFDGVAIYQSSFEDGGSTMRFTGYPMAGNDSTPFPLTARVGSVVTPGGAGTGDSIEVTDFRKINVENMSNGSGKSDARGVAHTTLKEKLDERLGSGAKTSVPLDMRNVGPSVQYKVRDKNGQAREYNNYMLPVTVDGQKVFLAGMRLNPDDAFRYLRLPADAKGSLHEWMLLRAALDDPALRAQAATRFAARAVKDSGATMQSHLADSALRVLNLFAGRGESGTNFAADSTPAGFSAVAEFISKSVPQADQEKAAGLLLRMLEGSVWDLWQIARTHAGEPEVSADAATSKFIQTSINALSDSAFYGAPVFLQLDGYKQVEASVFQLTRAPGEKVVYLGSLLLVLGIFSMFFVRERRIWFWLKDTPAGTHVLLAMSTARKTLDFEHEFTQMREAVAVELGASAPSDAAPPSSK